MFSEIWNLEQLASQATQLIDSCTLAQRHHEASHTLITSSTFSISKHAVIIASGYPERAGIWSYTLWEN